MYSKDRLLQLSVWGFGHYQLHSKKKMHRNTIIFHWQDEMRGGNVTGREMTTAKTKVRQAAGEESVPSACSCLPNLFAANSPAVDAARGPTKVIHNFSSGVCAATGSQHPVQSRFLSQAKCTRTWTLSCTL